MPLMPGENGLGLTRELRREGRVPVLLLTAMAEPEDRVNGLEQGADDYLSKPFEPRELVLRIRNLLQRRPAADAGLRQIRFCECRFDLIRGTVPRRRHRAPDGGRDRVALHLAEKPGPPLSREQLSCPSAGTGRNVDVQMTRLRRKSSVIRDFRAFCKPSGAPATC